MDPTDNESPTDLDRREIRRQRRDQRLARRAGKKPRFSIERVIENVKSRFYQQVTSLRVHGFVFLATSALLIGINIAFSPLVPWAFFPVAGWGIGLWHHVQALLNRRRELKQLSRAQELSEDAVKTLRLYQRSVGTWNQHRTAFLAVNAYVWGINLWTMAVSGYFVLWAAFLTGAWIIGLGCHWMGNMGRRRRLEAKLAELGASLKGLRGGRLPSRTGLAAGGSLHEKARAIRDEILEKYRHNDRLQSHWSDVEPLLNTLVEQIEALEKKRAEFDGLMRTFSVEGLENELADVRRKRDLSTDQYLKKEYERSITQYESHLQAAGGLARHRELLDVRLTSAFHLIKQLEIDTIRLLSVESYAEPSSFGALRAKTTETQEFLEDFQKSLDELEHDL